jgi:transposase
MARQSATSKRDPPELKKRAVRMVRELRLADPKDQGVVTRVARQLGVGSESLRNWIKHDEIEAGLRPGMTEAERLELMSLRKEVRELRRANDILQAAATFFGAELDRRPKR